MSLYKRTVEGLVKRRDNILNGGINCIPWNIPRFEEINPGIEQGRYYMVTANSKVGKSQITDQLFVYNPYKEYLSRQGSLKLKIFYFSLEMSEEQKMQQALSNLLFQIHNLRYSPRNLRSTKDALDQDILDKLLDFERYFEEYEKIITYISHVKNPYGIFSYMNEYAKANGKWIQKNGVGLDGKMQLVNDYYQPNDPDEYVIIIVDHASLINSEKGKTHYQAITDLSSKWFVSLRNNYGYTPVLIQQQMSSQESLEHIQSNMVKPSFSGLADNKTTQRDIDVAFGLYTPIRYGFKIYAGYDIGFFQDNIRFLEVIGAREGGGGKIIPLFFDGAVNYFKELPRPENIEAMQNVYNYINNIRGMPQITYNRA